MAAGDRDLDGVEQSLTAVSMSEFGPSTLLVDEAVPKRAAVTDEFPAMLTKPVYRSMPSLERATHTPDLDGLGPPPLVRSAAPKPEPGLAPVVWSDEQPAAAPVTEETQPCVLQPFDRLDKTHASLGVGRDPSAVAREVHGCLQDNDVDYHFKPHKAKWKCCHASHACMVEFVIRFWWRSPGADGPAGASAELVVEFQRRSGDHARLLQVYHATLVVLGVESPRTVTGPHNYLQWRPELSLPSMPAGGAPAPPAPGKLEDELEALTKTIQVFKDMVSGGLVDAALQGTRALAQLSMDKDLAMPLHQAGVVSVLIQFLEKPVHCGHVSNMARTFAVACIANLSEEPMVQSSLYAGTGLLLSLVDEGTFMDRAMRREAARTLRNLAQDGHGADSITQVIGRQELEAWCREKFPHIADPQMRTDVADVKQNLERRWQTCH